MDSSLHRKVKKSRNGKENMATPDRTGSTFFAILLALYFQPKLIGKDL
jgi:hypothetical protein